MTLTLDTSCVIHGAQRQAEGLAIEKLVALARTGRTRLSLATAFTADQERAAPERLAMNLAWLADRPVNRSIPGPFRLDYSRLDEGDVVVSDETAARLTVLERLLLPPRYWPGELLVDDPDFMERWRRKTHDVQHLGAHMLSGNDAFVTTDRGDVLRRRADLWKQLQIRVLSPQEVVSEVLARSDHEAASESD